MNYKIIQHKNIWFAISGALFVIAVAGLLAFGLKFGIDFTGGSLLEVKFAGQRPNTEEVGNKLKDSNLSGLSVQPAGENNIVLRFQESGKEKHDEAMLKLSELAGEKGESVVEEIRYDSVGPSIGVELKRKAILAIFWVLIAIVIYISIAFSKVSKPVASWKFGLSALIAMFHDVIITVGVFAILGKYFGVEINTPFVAATLTVLGYSVHDTIVVFDRIRENLPKSDQDFVDTVNSSLNQTLIRSLNTSLTVLLTLIAIIIFGGASIRSFALALTIGIFIGTYSSIFVASPLLVVWEKFGKKQ
jgi:preprotein translocase subunit SecF